MTDLDSGADDDSSAPESLARAPGSRRRPRGLVLAGVLCFAVLLLGLVWVVVTGLIARADLKRAQAELPQLRSSLLSGDTAKARTLGHDIADRAERAHSLSSGPAWWVAAHLPFVGRPLETSRTIAAVADSVGSSVLPGVVQLGETVHDSSLRTGDSINLSTLSSASAVISKSGDASAAALRRLLAAPSSSWLSTVDNSRQSLADQLTKLNGDLSGASRTLRTALPMLGQSGIRRYFVGFENEAESRGLGGLPGAFAILTVDHGTLAFTHFGDDDVLHGVSTDVNLGAEYNAQYGSANPTGVFQNSDISPDFRDAAQIWAGMWEKKTGEHIDGAMAIDPTALGYLLRVTGPARLDDGDQVTGDNVVAVTERIEYAKFPGKANKALRKKYVVAVSKAISKRITTAGGSTTALLKAVAHAARERRLVIWSSHPSEQANIASSGFAGVLNDGSSAPFTGFVTVNTAGSKLDYYLDRRLSYVRSGCGTGSTAVATITVTNNAPRSGLPPYVTIRADKPKYPTKPGDNRFTVTYFASPGARVTEVLVNGVPTKALAYGQDHGLPTISLDVESPVGRTKTIQVKIAEPAATQPVRTLVQPAVRPTQVVTSGSKCG